MNGNVENGNSGYKRKLSGFSFTKKNLTFHHKGHSVVQENGNSNDTTNHTLDGKQDSHKTPAFFQQSTRKNLEIQAFKNLDPPVSPPKQYSPLSSDDFYKNDPDGPISGPVTSFGTPVKFAERQSLDTINPFDKPTKKATNQFVGDIPIENLEIDDDDDHSPNLPTENKDKSNDPSNDHESDSDNNSMYTVISPPIQLESLPQRRDDSFAELFPKKQHLINGSSSAVHPNIVTHGNFIPPSRKRSKSHSTRMDFNLPYGDGSEKIYGMENLGASCYCNSILQSLFYTRDFRNYLLSMPPDLLASSIEDNINDKNNIRERKSKMDGKSTHNFILSFKNAENNKKDNGNGPNNNDDSPNNHTENGIDSESNHNNNEKSRRMSFFLSKKKDDQSNNNNNNGNNNSNSNSSNNHSQILNSSYNQNINKIVIPASENNGKELVIYRSTRGVEYPGLAGLKLSFEFPNRNVAVVGIVDEYTNYTSDNRKKQALIDGPILNIDHSLEKNGTTLYNALKDIFETMVENESQIGVVSSSWLFEVLKNENSMFHKNRHQDAHEFFNYLVNAIFEKIGHYYKQKKQFLQDKKNNKADISDELEKLQREIDFASEIFEGSLVSETKCLKCERITSRDEKFLDLSVDLLDMDNSSLNACLAQFSAKEILCEDNKFYCETCSALQEASKRMIIKQLPLNLVLHMKRFKFNERINNFTKLFHRVSYPLYMKLSNVSEDNKYKDNFYELYSVVVHLGGGPTFGHYVSLVKTEASGWLLFDDETVESIDESFVLKFFGDGPGLASAYILFYRMISPEEYLNKTLYNPANLDFDEVTKYEFEQELMEVHKNSQNSSGSFSTTAGSFYHNNNRRKSTVSKISQATSNAIDEFSDTTSLNTNSSNANNNSTNKGHENNNNGGSSGVFGNYSFKISDFGKRKGSIVTTNSDDSVGLNLQVNNIIHGHNKVPDTSSAKNIPIHIDTSLATSGSENLSPSHGDSLSSASSSNGGNAFGWINGFNHKKNNNSHNHNHNHNHNHHNDDNNNNNNNNNINGSTTGNTNTCNSISTINEDAKPKRTRSMGFKKSPFANSLKNFQNHNNDENENAVVLLSPVAGSAEAKDAGSSLNNDLDPTDIVLPVSDKAINGIGMSSRRRSIFGTLKRKKN